MSDLVSSGALNLVSLALSFLLLLVGLVLWFFVNRASSRTNEQIELLEALLDQQKRQNALLRRLCEASEPEKKEEEAPKTEAVEDNNEDDFIRLVAER
ncbi:TPA: YebO family protein [Kluyvera cryocrescens]